MTSSGVDVAKGVLAAFEQGGFPDVDGWIGWLAEDVELRSAIVGGAEGNTYHGHDEVRRWAREVDEALNDLHLYADEFREVGDRVVAIGHVSARGGGSGLELDVPIAWVLTVRDGKVATMHGYLDTEAALEAARAEAPPPG
jgi:ketosteroid isomerase-like protein